MYWERSRLTVGILNAAEDMVDTLRAFLREEGYAICAASIPDFKYGRLDASAWLGALAPTAILYDIPPPYEENWAFSQWVRALPAAAGHRFILTTPNEAGLERVVGPTDAIEFAGESFDLGEILDRVELALKELDQSASAPAR